MSHPQLEPIGTPGKIWQEKEKIQWFKQQTIKRSYQEEVVAKLEPLKEYFDVIQYGALSYDVDKYPLFVVKPRHWQADKKVILVTGGVHGYETSGVQGALSFVKNYAKNYQEHFNIIVAPCLSPWGYETINRWNPNAVDPNRSFYLNSPSEESAALMEYIEVLKKQFDVELLAHIDLHETTDTDNTTFRPALAARDAIEQTNWNIPDGFYLVGDSENPSDNFQKAIIASVEQITHIAPPDADNNIIGAPLSQWGVINYATKALGLCTGFSHANYCTTTEVYPDSPKVDEENCINAQVAAITGALDYLTKI